MQTTEVDVLLVEDSPSDAELTLHAFRKNNLSNNILHVKDGAEALEFLFCTGTFANRSPRHRPKVVLLDLKLPKIDGLEVLRRIRANEQTRTLPVVILTSSREDRDVVAGYDLGVNSYLVKPVDFTKFTEAVRQLGLYWLLMNEPPLLKEPS